MESITSREFEILLDALTVWESKDASDALFGDMIGTMIAGLGAKTEDEKETAKEQMDQEIEVRRKEAEIKVRAKKELVIVLKAKLLLLRDSSGIEEITNGSL